MSDLANEEVQREISLTLNDMDYDIVVDTPTTKHVISDDSSGEIIESTDACIVDKIAEVSKDIPDLDEKTPQGDIACLAQERESVSQTSLDFDGKDGKIDG